MALREKRPTPSSTPRIVVSTMPSTATRSVLRMPTTNARQYASVLAKGIMVSLMSKPAVCNRKPKPLWMPRARMLPSVLPTIQAIRPASPASTSTW
jgi:hypothetical protein